MGRLHGEWFACHRETTPTDLQFRTHEAILDGPAQGTRLTPENLAWVDEKIKEPGWAKQFLISAGLLDSKGHWNPSYWPEDGEAGSK